MARLIVRLVFLLAAMAFIMFNNAQKKNTPATQAEESAHQTDISFENGRYNDRFNGYSLKQPDANWKFSPSARSNNLIKLDITHQTGKYGLQVRVHQKGGQSFDEFVQSYIERFKSDMQNPEIISQGEFSGEGIIGQAIAFDGQKRNGYFLKSYVFPGTRFYYALQGGCPFVQKDELESELDKIAASFKSQ